MKIAVYCSSRWGLDPQFEEMAGAVGHWIGSHGHTLVFGGCRAGLMHTLAQSCHEAGGTVVGVITEGFLHRLDNDNVDQVVVTRDLGERKAVMIERSDVFVALPGGLGTIDEIFSTLSQIHVNKGDTRGMIIANVNGTFDHVTALLRSCANSPFADVTMLTHCTEARNTTQLLELLNTIEKQKENEK